jgi:hypothetical protein
MIPICKEGISALNGIWLATCACGVKCKFASKNNAIKMLDRGNCRACRKDSRSAGDSRDGIYLNGSKEWCSVCSGCGKEQAYTRRNHARQSAMANWQCKKCAAAVKAFSANAYTGNCRRLYNKFQKSASDRAINWSLSLSDFIDCYTGKCALTGWELSMQYGKTTASLDRIDSTRSYEVGNVQWVHSMVNMCKNRYDQARFVEMCQAIAENADKVKP